MKNKIGMLLMEAGVSYNKQRLHKAGYFRELLASNPDIDEGLGSLLRLCRETVVRLGKTESALVRALERDSLLVERVERLMTIPAVGPITALTWAHLPGKSRCRTSGNWPDIALRRLSGYGVYQGSDWNGGID